MPTQKEKLEEIRRRADPQSGMREAFSAIMDGMRVIRGPKGEKGDKGDSLSEEEIAQICDYVQSRVKDGKNGERGEPGPQGEPGRDGRTPERNIDYWTPSDQEETVRQVLSRIKVPKPKDGVSPDVKEIVRQATEEISKIPFDVSKILRNPDLRLLLHGGGLGVVTTDSTLSGNGTPSDPLKVVGGGFSELAATGTVNGSNQTFTFARVPTYIVSDGAWYKKLDNNGGVQWSSSGLTVTMTVAPQSSIFGIA